MGRASSLGPSYARLRRRRGYCFREQGRKRAHDIFSDSLITGSELPDGFLSLTYNDGPGPQTLDIGRHLANQGICATFFVCGSHVLGNEGTLDKLVRWGHRIGNHTFSHPSLCSAERITQPWRLSWRVADIIRADQIVRRYANGPWIPFGLPMAIGAVKWRV